MITEENVRQIVREEIVKALRDGGNNGLADRIRKAQEQPVRLSDRPPTTDPTF